MITWGQFIEAARNQKWPDFKIYDTIQYGLSDAGIENNLKEAILQRCRLYFIKNKNVAESFIM